jgi:hypothetical protein
MAPRLRPEEHKPDDRKRDNRETRARDQHIANGWSSLSLASFLRRFDDLLAVFVRHGPIPLL